MERTAHELNDGAEGILTYVSLYTYIVWNGSATFNVWTMDTETGMFSETNCFVIYGLTTHAEAIERSHQHMVEALAALD